MVICQNYGHFAKKKRSVIISQNHYLNKILDVHPLKNNKFFFKKKYHWFWKNFPKSVGKPQCQQTSLAALAWGLLKDWLARPARGQSRSPRGNNLVPASLVPQHRQVAFLSLKCVNNATIFYLANTKMDLTAHEILKACNTTIDRSSM